MSWQHEDLVVRAVDYALSLGAKYAEARYHKVARSGVAARNGEFVGLEKGFKEGVAVRVLVDGALGFSSTDTLTWEGVKTAVDEALAKARAHSKLMKRPIELSHERLGRASYEALEKEKAASVSVEEKVAYCADVWKHTSTATSTARVATLTMFLGESIEEKIIASSDGAFIRSKIPRVSLWYNVVVTIPSKGTVQRFFSHAASGGYEWVKKWNVLGYLPEDAKTFERIIVEAVKPPTDKPIDVVVGSEIVGLMVHESCGHPSEADRILGREAAQAGKSFIKPDMRGQRIGGEVATVIDDPTIPGSNGFYLYDDEGVPARPRYLYKEGVINEFLHNRWTAKVFNTQSNAAARAMDHASEPIVRMANTYFKPGDHTLEELIEGVKYGVYIKSYMEWNIDDIRWGQRYVGLEAYLIENGELTKPVRNPALEITTGAFYSKVDAAGKELRFYPGMCGKGEPSQGVPVWFGGPDVRLRSVKLGVVA